YSKCENQQFLGQPVPYRRSGGLYLSKAPLHFVRIAQLRWNTEKLTTETEITDNYKNTENVRALFKNQIGDKFKFNVKFMNWMKYAQGKNLGDAIEQ
nr:DUF6434 domain-containing protein [Salinivirgaceae bacterium]